MKSSIKLALVAAVAIAGITACTSAPAGKNALPQTGIAPQTTSAAPTSSTKSSETPPPPTVVTEVVTETVTNQPQPVAAVKVDNRLGYGALKLGMTLEEARAAGLHTDLTWAGNESKACIWDGKVMFSREHGLARITLPADAKTSKGIGVGATFDDLKRVYPNASVVYQGASFVNLDDQTVYWFYAQAGNADKIARIELHLRAPACMSDPS